MIKVNFAETNVKNDEITQSQDESMKLSGLTLNEEDALKKLGISHSGIAEKLRTQFELDQNDQTSFLDGNNGETQDPEKVFQEYFRASSLLILNQVQVLQSTRKKKLKNRRRPDERLSG